MLRGICLGCRHKMKQMYGKGVAGKNTPHRWIYSVLSLLLFLPLTWCIPHLCCMCISSVKKCEKTTWKLPEERPHGACSPKQMMWVATPGSPPTFMHLDRWTPFGASLLHKMLRQSSAFFFFFISILFGGGEENKILSTLLGFHQGICNRTQTNKRVAYTLICISYQF